MIRLIHLSLRNPVTVTVSFLAIVFFSWLALRSMQVDIFPRMGTPTIYVAQPYGGLSPAQVEGFVTSYYEYHFLYVTGVKSVESKSVQGASLIKIEFNEGTDMSQAMGEVVGYVNRSRAFMPPGTVPPFITRFDAGSLPVGQLVFRSETRTLSEIQDLALFKVRPMFSTLPGVSAPPPFGGNQKTVVIRLDPEKIRAFGIAPEKVVEAIVKSNPILPAGNLRIGDEQVIANQQTVAVQIRDLEMIPLKAGTDQPVFVRDLGSVEMGADITTGYALINGKRSVYIPVTKRADAATWDVVQRVKAALPEMQAAIPDDIRVSYEFDQSGYVLHSLRSLITEGLLGALLTGLVVLLFLGDPRGALMVVVTIPLSLLTAIIGLRLLGQSINIMTLGGLALAIGILVDEATVTIEHIHHHQESGKSRARAVLDACREIASPKLLILLCILAVFVPSLFMTGVPGAMFLPLSLAVGLAMIASFLLSQTLVPVAASRFLAENAKNKGLNLSGVTTRYRNWLKRISGKRKLLTVGYMLAGLFLGGSMFFLTGKEVFPQTDGGQIQVRLRLQTGTRLERTEEATLQLLHLADEASEGHVAITSAFAGVQPSSYPVNLIHLWTSGPHEAVVRINLDASCPLSTEAVKDRLREAAKQKMPHASLSFEPGDLVEKVINMGADNPIEVLVQGKDLNQTRQFADSICAKLSAQTYLKDVQLALPLDYPEIKIAYDRVRIGQSGLTLDEVARTAVTATSSSRFIQPSYWLDAANGNAYQVQVEYPPFRMNGTGPLGAVPVSGNAEAPVYLRDVAQFEAGFTPGAYLRINQQRTLPITANLSGTDLGKAIEGVQSAVASLGPLPTGVKISIRGQSELLRQTQTELQTGLVIALIAIFLMLAVFFQSFRLSFAVLLITPAVLGGSWLFLLSSGNTLNIQSYIGTIMALGVAFANAILYISQGEVYRKQHHSSFAVEGAGDRLRPILMTSLAMISGMIPMAIGLGDGSEQTAPLAIAVIGGLLFSTLSTLLFLPVIYSLMTGQKPYSSPSLDPDDPTSKTYEPANL
jgi:multidrug efflux pump subunit AcrB